MKAKQEKIEDEWSEVEAQREEINYVKWETEGTEVCGVLKDIFEGKECTFAKVDTGAELLTMFSVPSLLKDKLAGCIGETVKVVYIGKVKFNSGRYGKDFKVYVKGKKVEGKPEKPASPSVGAYV